MTKDNELSDIGELVNLFINLYDEKKKIDSDIEYNNRVINDSSTHYTEKRECLTELADFKNKSYEIDCQLTKLKELLLNNKINSDQLILVYEAKKQKEKIKSNKHVI